MILNRPVILEGAHNTGKSTLLKRLAGELNVPYYKEIARTILTERGLTGDFSTLDTKTICEIQDQMIEAIYAKVATGEPCIIDRGCVSVYAYSIEWLARTGTTAAQDTLRRAQEAVRKQRHIPHITLLLPPNIPIENDGLRETSEFVRNRIHYSISGILDSYGYEVGRIQSDDKDMRLAEALYFTHQYLAIEATKGNI